MTKPDETSEACGAGASVADRPGLFADPGFTIGSIRVGGRALMAPMVGYNEPPLRKIFRRFGSALCITEMIKPEKMDKPSKMLLRELELSPEEHPVGAQISAREPEPALRAAAKLRAMGYDLIDINFGCPLKKECVKGRGAAMMQEPRLVAELFTVLTRELDCPVTVKMRSGWDEETPSAPTIARVAVDHGAAAVCVHGRSKMGWYKTVNDRAIIATTRAAVTDVPFIANGDITSVEDALTMFRETGCDAVMIGRGSVGNPWIFRRVSQALLGGEVPPQPDFAEVRAVFTEHAEGLHACFKHKTALRLARKYAFFYFARWIDSDDRARCAKVRDLKGLMAFVASLEGRPANSEADPLTALKEGRRSDQQAADAAGG